MYINIIKSLKTHHESTKTSNPAKSDCIDFHAKSLKTQCKINIFMFLTKIYIYKQQ